MPAGEDEQRTERPAQSIAELYAEIEDALAAAFPKSRELWVRGEIQKLTEAASGHCYLDVVDSDVKGERNAPVLKVKCWRITWAPLKAKLRREGVTLEAGLTVVLRGSIGFYQARGEIDFTLLDVDSDALVGRLARQRQELLDRLGVEGLLDAQRALEVALVPLSIGLVGSPGTEGYQDFLGQLARSGFAFSVHAVATAVQGTSAPEEIAAALATLAAEPLDVICVVRGGGAKADLAAFDTPVVARAIATSKVVVWTGIGHTGDESVADLVANRSHITPTACGVALVEAVAAYWTEVVAAARVIADGAELLCRDEAARHLERRRRLVNGARQALRDSQRQLSFTRSRLIAAPSASLAAAGQSLDQRTRRLVPAAHARLTTQLASLEGTRRLLSAFDPRRNLERGWTLTLDAEGQIVRSAKSVTAGSAITTRMVDGEIDSSVTATRATKEAG